jgi:hypothetical protein
MLSTYWNCLRAVAFLALLTIAGCGSGGPRTYRIPGKLTYDDGSPVTGASVVLQTTVKDQPVVARGMATPDGKFELTTFTEGDGVVAGEHQVSISPLPIAEGTKSLGPPIPSQYWDFSTSQLTTTVTPQTAEILITLSRNAKK